MSELKFNFFRTIESILIDNTMRVSIWLSEDSSYLMPCAFKTVEDYGDYFSITVQILDPENRISMNSIEKEFLFGHPGKIIGYGFLKKIG